MTIDHAAHPTTETEHVPNPQRRALLEGVRDTLPLLLGAMPFGIIFGALSITNGLSVLLTLALSSVVFAGSAQFIAVGLIAQGVGVPLIVLTTAVVNLRHALYSASLGPFMRGLSQRWLVPLGFFLTDETFAVVFRRWYERKPHAAWYQLGSSLAMYANWQLMTIIGIVAGTSLDGITEWGLDFAMVVTFIGIVVPLIVTRSMLACAVVAAVVGVAAQGLPHNLGLMVAAVVGILAGVVTERVLRGAGDESEKS
jgi:4-azaleucine resistance transporter AzlC